MTAGRQSLRDLGAHHLGLPSHLNLPKNTTNKNPKPLLLDGSENSKQTLWACSSGHEASCVLHKTQKSTKLIFPWHPLHLISFSDQNSMHGIVSLSSKMPQVLFRTKINWNNIYAQNTKKLCMHLQGRTNIQNVHLTIVKFRNYVETLQLQL